MSLRIGARLVSVDTPLFVVAELGLNHDGDVDLACQLVEAAAAAGASAIKLQTLRADRLMANDSPAPIHVTSSIRERFAAFELDEAAHGAIFATARHHNLATMSTPLHDEAVELLERVGVDAYKIASGDLTNHRLIERAAATGRPLVLSTGMAELFEVDAALRCARGAGATDIAVLHCVSAYPTPLSDQQLRAIRLLRERFDVPVGLSDHSRDPLAPFLALALGASIYERHLILDAAHAAIDAAVSSTPEALRDVVVRAADVQAALGREVKTCMAVEAGNRLPSRRSLYAARALAPGERLDAGAIVALRPGGGLDPSRWRDLLGCQATRSIAAGERLVEADVEPYREPYEERREAV